MARFTRLYRGRHFLAACDSGLFGKWSQEATRSARHTCGLFTSAWVGRRHNGCDCRAGDGIGNVRVGDGREKNGDFFVSWWPSPTPFKFWCVCVCVCVCVRVVLFSTYFSWWALSLSLSLSLSHTHTHTHTAQHSTTLVLTWFR